MFGFTHYNVLLVTPVQVKTFTVKSSLPIIINDLVGLLLDQFDCWEALHFDVFQLVGGSVHFADDNALVILKRQI